MGKKIFAKLLSMFLFSALLLFPVGAQTDKNGADLLQAYVSGDILTLFTSGKLRYDSLKCAVSNQNPNFYASGRLSDGAIKIKTTVLVDVSSSAPEVLQDAVEALLKKLIEGKPANEEFKIVAFGETSEIISDFNADRYDLAKSVEKIKPENGKGKIYDAIYNSIQKTAPDENQPAFCRTIAIAGGDADGSITKEELYLKLNGEMHPVDIVELVAGEAEKNKNLAAIARVGKGRHYILNPETDAGALAEMLGAGDYFYYAAAIPIDLLDGSVRQVDIGDGTNEMSLDLKFPVFADSSKKILQEENIENAEKPKEAENAEIYIVFGIAFSAFTTMMIVVGTLRKKNKKNYITSKSGFVSENGGGETEFSGEEIFRGEKYVVKFGSASAPGKSWAFPIEDELLIGRSEKCRLRLDDKSVSREQCKITVEDAKLVVVHLGATNKTAVNGVFAEKSAPLQIGDTIKFGRESLRVEYLRTPGKPNFPSSDSLQNIGKGKTALLF